MLLLISPVPSSFLSPVILQFFQLTLPVSVLLELLIPSSFPLTRMSITPSPSSCLSFHPPDFSHSFPFCASTFLVYSSLSFFPSFHLPVFNFLSISRSPFLRVCLYNPSHSSIFYTLPFLLFPSSCFFLFFSFHYIVPSLSFPSTHFLLSSHPFEISFPSHIYISSCLLLHPFIPFCAFLFTHPSSYSCHPIYNPLC